MLFQCPKRSSTPGRSANTSPIFSLAKRSAPPVSLYFMSDCSRQSVRSSEMRVLPCPSPACKVTPLPCFPQLTVSSSSFRAQPKCCLLPPPTEMGPLRFFFIFVSFLGPPLHTPPTALSPAHAYLHSGPRFPQDGHSGRILSHFGSTVNEVLINVNTAQ